ncbi:MAG: alpha-amylase family glycosyl hydrolase [Candidatus Kapabacteria bacterium]|nr:alpha-amylase family glycosyl hydrolase [Candidatus Kapabacteria bacterium]
MKPDFFKLLKNDLELQKNSQIRESLIEVPALWDFTENSKSYIQFQAIDYYLKKINDIEILAKSSPLLFATDNWTDEAIIYNMLIRFTTAYHSLDIRTKSQDARIEKHFHSGTFLSAIAILPYLHKLGCNTIYLLPITEIGKYSAKGNLGSPYSIRDHYGIDSNLRDDRLNLTTDEQFAAFTQAAKMLGMKIVLEFVFRTSSLDNELAIDHPEWFYWIKDNVEIRKNSDNDSSKYGPPAFTTDELIEIKDKINNSDFNNLIAPNHQFQQMFTETPAYVEHCTNKLIGHCSDGTTCKIPPAFADWPPDDTQPPWSDVTYLKLHDHPDFNYIAYNTVRMYDQELLDEKNNQIDLWDYLSKVIPTYIEKFDIDGIMLDMGHALPHKLRENIISTAKASKPEFVFFEENFSLDRKSAIDGFSAVVGYMPFDNHIPYKVKEIIRMLENGDCPILFFGTPENHNTRRAAARAGGLQFSKVSFIINSFLPIITFIHSGFELGEKSPVNTGLGFEQEELAKFPAENLPLFSTASLDWTSSGDFPILISEVNSFKRNNLDFKYPLANANVKLIETGDSPVIVFFRKTKDSEKQLIILANLSSNAYHLNLDLGMKISPHEIHFSSDMYFGADTDLSDGSIELHCEPFSFIVLSFSDFNHKLN